MFYKHPQFDYIYSRNWALQKQWLARSGGFKRLAYGFAAFFMVLSLAILNIAKLPIVHASSPYQASDVLGAPNFNTSNVTSSGLDTPGTAVVDGSNHRLFISDSNNNRILVYNLDTGNKLSGHSAVHVLGQPDFVSHGTGLSASALSGPQGMAYDAVNDRLFVNDSGNSRILVYDLSSGITDGMAAAHVLGQADFVSGACNAGGSLGASVVCSPYGGLYFDTSTSYLFVSDLNNARVLVFDLSSGITDGMAAVHVLGEPDFATANGCGTTDATTLCVPKDLAYDSVNKRLFVADGQFSRVLVFDLSSGITDGMAAIHVLGQPNLTSFGSGSGPSGLNSPSGLAYSTGSQTLFVADVYNYRAITYDLSGGITDGMAASHVFGEPDLNTGSTCDYQNVTAKTFCLSSNFAGVNYDPASQQFILADQYFNRVLFYDLSSGISDYMAASDDVGQVDASGNPVFITRYSDNETNSDFGGYLEGGTLIDTTHHRLFATACGNWVNEYDLDSSNNLVSHSPTHILGVHDENTSPTPNTIDCPAGLAYDSSRDLLFVLDDNSRVLVYDLSGGITDSMNAVHVIGQTDLNSGSCNQGGSPADNTLCYPYGGLAFDPTTKYLYVGDYDNARVMVFDTSTISDGMSAVHVIGQPDFASNTENVTADGLSRPYGLAIDNVNHRLFVADWASAGRVMVYDLTNLQDGMSASHVLGEADFTSANSASDNGNVDDKSFGPSGLAYDSVNQRLFVEDDNAYRILIFDVSSITDNQSAVGVLGQPDLTSGDSSTCIASQTTVCDPEGISDYYDSGNKRLYVSDSNNNRVLIFNFAKLASAVPAGTAGTAYSVSTLGSQTQGTTTYSVTAGSLPAGLSLNSSTGALSGTPTTAGTSNFTVSLSDNNGAAGTFTDSKSYSLTVNSSGGGGSSGGSSGSGSTKKTYKPGSASNPYVIPTTTTSNTIDLDTFEDFTGSDSSANSHEQAGLKAGDTLKFTIKNLDGNTENHTITIDIVTDSTVALTIHSAPLSLTLTNNYPEQADINGDGTKDIGLEATAITPPTARIRFWKVAAAAAPITDNSTAQDTSQLQAATPAGSQTKFYLAAGVIFALAAIMGVWNWRHSKNQPPVGAFSSTSYSPQA